MTPQALLDHLDKGTFWPVDHGVAADGDLARAVETALAVRGLRERRGERVAGYKIGWTNRANWSRMGVAGPMWGTLHETTLVDCDGRAEIALGHFKLPRLEPEIVVGFARTPAPDASFDALFEALEWVAPGFEIVQTHLPDWQYTPAQTLADSAVHALLVIGARTPVGEIAPDGEMLAELLAQAGVRLYEDDVLKARGLGSVVLDGPLHALRRFVLDMAATPGATPLRAGDVVTTGTWTDAQSLAPGQAWRADFDSSLGSLEIVLR